MTWGTRLFPKKQLNYSKIDFFRLKMQEAILAIQVASLGTMAALKARTLDFSTKGNAFTLPCIATNMPHPACKKQTERVRSETLKASIQMTFH